ncbi:hypothetical protein KY346_05575, partial [Candidatus Woesearchaeota archaeon]|nr:hypothetical protein [Candidatus Woesearchaeota archaeon]
MKKTIQNREKVYLLCRSCGKQFGTHFPKDKYCRRCHKLFLKQTEKPVSVVIEVVPKQKHCKVCGVKFTTKLKGQKYCSECLSYFAEEWRT